MDEAGIFLVGLACLVGIGWLWSLWSTVRLLRDVERLRDMMEEDIVHLESKRPKR